jgi:hypothetical protein
MHRANEGALATADHAVTEFAFGGHKDFGLERSTYEETGATTRAESSGHPNIFMRGKR